MNEESIADPAGLQEELVRARERLAATQKILNVISQSREDEFPVFDVVLRTAARLCEASMADPDLVDAEGRRLREVATWGTRERATSSDRWVWPIDSDFLHVTALRNGEVAHVSDIRETDRHRSGDTTTRTVVDVEGISAFLPVPLVSRDRSIGCLVLFRQVPVAFTEDQIELARTFAAQAVIAIKTRIPQLIRWFRCPL